MPTASPSDSQPARRVSPPVSSRWLPVLAALAIAAVLSAFGLAEWQRQHREILALREEIAALRLAQRSASSHDGLLRDANDRASRAESALATLQRETAEAATRTKATHEEMERVIAFLRSEINAAQETIQQLQATRPPETPERTERTGRGAR